MLGSRNSLLHWEAPAVPAQDARKASWLLQGQLKSWLSLELCWGKPRFPAQSWRLPDLALGVLLNNKMVWTTLDSRQGVGLGNKLQSLGSSWPAACFVNKVLLKHMQPICVCAVRGFSCMVAELSSRQCWRALLYGSLKKIADPVLCRNLRWMLTSGLNLEPIPGQVEPMVLLTFTPSFAILVRLRHVCSLRLYLWKPFLAGGLSWSIEPPPCCT